MKFAVVGAGSMANRRIRHVQQLAAGDLFVYDVRADRRAEVERSYGVRTVDSLGSLIAENPDAIFVSVPPAYHRTYVDLAVERGWHFMTEQPIFHTDDGLDELVEAVELRGLITHVSCNPLSAVVGRREVMELFSEVFFSFTFGGEAVSLAAAKATLGVMRSEPVMSHLWNQGRKLQEGYNTLAESFGLAEYTRCVGLSPRTIIGFTDGDGQDSLLLKSLFQQEVVKRGVLSAGYHNLSYSHSDADVEHTLRAYEETLRVMAMAIDSGDVGRYIEGEPVQPVFRKI